MREISKGAKKDAGYYREVWGVFAEVKAAQNHITHLLLRKY